MLKRSISALLLLCALFSGHLLAHRQGHEYFPVQSLEQQLLHEADSDELRSQHERPPQTCANITAGRTTVNRGHPANSIDSNQAPLRFGSVFIRSSGLTEATMLPGCGILRIWF